MGFLSVSKMARAGGGGRLFEGGDYFKYFGQRGAIIRGRRLIEGRLLFEEILKFSLKGSLLSKTIKFHVL